MSEEIPFDAWHHTQFQHDWNLKTKGFCECQEYEKQVKSRGEKE